jgi:hypothetical protein
MLGRMRIGRTALLLSGLGLGLSLGACSDDDDAPACPSVSGTWEVTQHCQPNNVGSQLSVVQDGCSITTNGVDTEFRGSVAASGEVSVQGSLLGLAIQCTGTATSVHVTLNCGGCQVTLERP